MKAAALFSSPWWGVVRYEFLMQIRRKALWIALTLAQVFVIFMSGDDNLRGLNLSFAFQLLVPLVAGYFLSDRLYRDRRLGTSEIIGTSKLETGAYIWGKYAGVVGATSLVTVLLLVGLVLANLLRVSPAPNENFLSLLVPSLISMVTSYLFIGAFCLALPVVLPLRLYQILFSCYWLWAFQARFPSVAGTPLSPGGQYPVSLLFRDQLHLYLRGVEDSNWTQKGIT